MTELLLRNANIWGREGTADLRIAEGRIAAIGAGLTAAGGAETVDLGGAVVVPGLVDAHCHVDKTLWSGPWVPKTPVHSLEEQVDFEADNRHRYGIPSADNTHALLRDMTAAGTTHIRTHTDVDPGIGLRGLENVAEAAERNGHRITVEQVAFPQRGMLRRPGTEELLREAVKSGLAQVVGGIDPAGLDNDPIRHLDIVFGLADTHGAKLDIHLHDGGTLGAWQFDRIIERTRALGLRGRVTISHAFALADAVGARQEGLIADLAELDISLTTVAPSKGMPPLRAMREAGANVGGGNDGVRDLWSPFGDGSMMERAHLIALRGGGRLDGDLELAMRVATYGGAHVLGLGADGYGLETGSAAHLLALPVRNVPEAVTRRPKPSLVVKDGRVTVREGQLV